MAVAPPPGEAPFSFRRALSCNMCGAPPGDFRYLGRRLDAHQGLLARRRGGVAVSVYRCGHCGLTFPDPMPIPVSVAELYDVDPEGYWTDEYFQVEPSYLASQCATALELLGSRPGPLRALDVGAGIGKGILGLRRAGFEAFGIEPSPSFRALAQERMGLGSDDVLATTLEDAHFAPDSFDFVNLGAVLEHLADPRAALVRIAPWLRGGGVVYVEVPSADWLLGRMLNAFYRVTGQGLVTNTSPMHPPFHLYEFTLAAFEAAGRTAGLAVAKVERFVGDVYAPGPLRGVLRGVMERTETGMQLVVWLRAP